MNTTVQTPTQLQAARVLTAIVGEGLTRIIWHLHWIVPAYIEGQVPRHGRTDDEVRDVIGEYAALFGGQIVTVPADGYTSVSVRGWWDGIPVWVWGHVDKTGQGDTQTGGACDE